MIFIATTGQGSPPHTVKPLWKQLMKKNYKLECQEDLFFAIYSLGDRAYGDNFAMAGRKLRQRLKMLGGKELV